MCIAEHSFFLSFPPIMPTVICTYSYCSRKKVIVYGVEQPGQAVHSTTRLSHRRKDKKPKARKSHSSPSTPNSGRESTQPQAPPGNKDETKKPQPLIGE